MKFSSLSSLLDSKRFLMVFSLVTAAVVWLATTVMTQNETDYLIRDIPVVINQNSDMLLERNLHAIIDKEKLVNVRVRGPRTMLGSLSLDDFVINALMSSVTEPGVYDLPLEVAANSNVRTISEISLMDITPSMIEVRFDSIATRVFTIEPHVRGLSTSADFMSDPERLTPPRVTVTGPHADLERIDKAVVSVDLNEPLTRTFAANLPIMLQDAQGNEIDIDSRHVVLDYAESQLRIDVRKLRTLPLIVRFNAPPGFPQDELKSLMHLSDHSLTVAGPVDTVDNYHELPLGFVNLAELTPQNNVFTFQVELPSAAFINVNNVDTVVADFVTRDWSSANFNLRLSQDNFINMPHNYTVRLLTTSLPNVTMVGDAQALEGLTANDIAVTINLADRELRPGQYNYPVSISAPTKGLVWAVGEHFAVIQVSE